MEKKNIEGRDPLQRLVPQGKVDEEVLGAIVADVLHSLLAEIPDLADEVGTGGAAPVGLEHHRVEHAAFAPDGHTSVRCTLDFGGQRYEREWRVCVVLSPPEAAIAAVVADAGPDGPVPFVQDAVLAWARA